MYSKRSLEVAVDNTGQAVYGSIPARYREKWRSQWVIRRGEEDDAKTSRLVLRDSFGYCLEPGTYSVLAMQFISDTGYIADSGVGYWFFVRGLT